MLTSEQAAYIAGVIDGEGCITTSGLRHFRVQIANTNSEWLEHLARWVGGTVQEHRGRFNKRPSFSLSLGVRESQEALRQCQPFLMIKHRQAALFFEWIELRAQYAPTIRQGFPSHPNYVAGVMSIKERLRELNKRGVHGQQYPGAPKSTRTCQMNACDRQHYSNGYCKQHYKKYIERGGPKWHERNCERCAKPFVAKRSDARFCSRECNYAVYYSSHREAYLARSAAHREAKKPPS